MSNYNEGGDPRAKKPLQDPRNQQDPTKRNPGQQPQRPNQNPNERNPNQKNPNQKDPAIPNAKHGVTGLMGPVTLFV